MTVPMIIESSKVKISIDQPIPAMAMTMERRPDTRIGGRRIVIIEVAVAADGLVL